MLINVDADLAQLVEIGSELRDMAREHAVSLEYLEPLAARIGLAEDATRFTIADHQRRLRVLTLAYRHFEQITAAVTRGTIEAPVAAGALTKP